MICKGLIYRVLVTSVTLVLLASFAFADTIRLKDGSTVKGRITGFSDGKFTVTVGEGTRKREFTFDANEIESIQFDRSDAGERTAEVVKTPVKLIERPVVTEPDVQTEKPQTSEPVKSNSTTTVSSGNNMKPVVLSVNVMADNTANGWTNSGWVVRKGQRIRIIGEGEVSLGKGQKTGPSGSYTLEDGTKLLKSVPTGALIAVIGDDNNDFIYIGADREFVATRDGTLFLGLNEGNLNDNSGAFKVKIEIMPGN
jgi:hypothetical protein